MINSYWKSRTNFSKTVFFRIDLFESASFGINEYFTDTGFRHYANLRQRFLPQAQSFVRLKA
jgi:hypothetical protein